MLGIKKNIMILCFVISLGGGACSSSSVDKALEAVYLKDKEIIKEPVVPQYPHPNRADPVSTKEVLLSFSSLVDQDYQTCRDALFKLADSVGDDQQLLEAKDSLVSDVEKKRVIYHWCFYTVMKDLDDQLYRFDMNFNDKAKLFYKEMKALWMLARAFKQIPEDEQYFLYLQKRYIQISKEVFGRNVSILAPPIDERIRKKSQSDSETEEMTKEDADEIFDAEDEGEKNSEDSNQSADEDDEEDDEEDDDEEDDDE